MRRIPIWPVFLGALCIASSVLADGENPNLVANPGLEVDADADGVPDHWSVARPSDYPADWHVAGGAAEVGVSPVARSGEHSIVYSVPSPVIPPVAPEDWWDYSAWDDMTKATGGHWSVAFKTDDFPVNEYHLCSCHCWVRAENIQQLHVKFIATFVYPGRQEPSVHWIHPLLHDPSHETHKSGTWDWEPWGAVVAVPEFVTHGRIEFWVREWAAPAKLYCDDMSVTDEGEYPFFERRRDR